MASPPGWLSLGLTMAATLTELAPLLRAGNLVQGSSVVANLTEAVIRGISVPLVTAAATGCGPGREQLQPQPFWIPVGVRIRSGCRPGAA